MFETNARVRIPTPQRYALRLAKYFGHRVSVHREDALMRHLRPAARAEEFPIAWSGSGEAAVANTGSIAEGLGR